MTVISGATRWTLLSVLAAMFFVVPASASADFQLSVNPNPINFGNRDGVDNQDFEIDLTLSNEGSSAGSTDAYFGSEGQFWSGAFGVENKSCATSLDGFYLGAGGSCQLTVTFNPHNQSLGPKNALLTLDWSGADISVPISANIIEGLPDTHFVTSPSSVNFGTLDPSVDDDFESEIEIENDGGNPIIVDGYFGSSGQKASGGFSVKTGTCSSTVGGWFVQHRGERCKIIVAFNPIGREPGQYNSNLVLDSNANDITIPLSATTAYAGSASVNTTDLDLGETQVTYPKSATVTLTSTSAVPLKTGPIEITEVEGSEYPGNPFTFSVPNNCDGMVSGQHCDVTVWFQPGKGWAYEGELQLVGNFNPITVKLSGTGTGMRASVSPELDFGERIVNTSTNLTTPFVSTGNLPINLDSAAISGAGAAAYSLEYDSSTCQDLEYRERCEFQVTYSPTSPGKHPAELVVTGDFLTRKIQLTGSARNLTPKLSIVLSGPKKVKRGKTLVLKAKVSNKGDLDAKAVTLRTIVPKQLASKVPPIRIKVFPYGKSVTRTIRIKVKKTAKKGKALKVKLTASGRNFKSASASRAARIR